MILLGSLASILVLVSSIISIQSSFTENFGYKEILALLAVVPNLGYLCRMLGQYDQAIMVRQEEILKKRADVINTYEGLVNDIDGLLGKSTESSALLAESGFESKRRDFI